jgi:heme oxygenase (biliverdin-producing, ferredoxin)
MDTAATPTIHTALREGTRELHVKAERSPFMAAFFRGQLGKEHYVELLSRLHPVYVAMEAATRRHHGDAALGPFDMPELYRADALAEDLRFFGGAPKTTPAAQTYIDRINQCADHWPAGVVAHHYTRYLGDLSGGQMIKRMVMKQHGLTDKGTAFYEFPQVGDIPAFKARYHDAMNNMPLDADGVARLTQEACDSFVLNIGIFDELDKAR